MTKTQFLKKIRYLLRQSESSIEKKCLRLFSSGALDPKDYGNDYILPKMIITVAFINAVDYYYPLSPKGKREIENLKHF